MATTEEEWILSDEEIVTRLAECEKAGLRLERDFNQLMEEYPNQWVAVSKDGLVAHHPELNDAIALYRAAGYESYQVELKYMDPNPRPLVI